MTISKRTLSRKSIEKMISEVGISRFAAHSSNIEGMFSIHISHIGSKRNILVPILINIGPKEGCMWPPIAILTIDKSNLPRKVLLEFQDLSVNDACRMATEILSQLDCFRLVKRSVSIQNLSKIIRKEKIMKIENSKSFTLGSYCHSPSYFSYIILEFNMTDSYDIEQLTIYDDEETMRSSVELYIKGNIS